MQAYTPSEKHFENVFVVEKTETKQGWSYMSPDEGWFTGYQHEMDAFIVRELMEIPLKVTVP